MKRLILFFTLLLTMLANVNAQKAVEYGKLTDNLYIGAGGGISSPLDFNSVTPFNPSVSIFIGKDVTPLFGLEVQGTAILGDNHFADAKTFVRATNVGLNGKFNLSNAIGGLRTVPRLVEVSTTVGLGWLHYFSQKPTSITCLSNYNALSAKTGLDIAFNLGKKKNHVIVLTPSVYWNLTAHDKVQFNKNHAQLALEVGYRWYFNGRHKIHDISNYKQTIAEQKEVIESLNKQLAEKPTEIIKTVEVPTTNAINTSNASCSKWYVLFAKNSAKITSEGQKVLDSVGDNLIVDIEATASPEGSKDYNKQLSVQRAKNVAEYLTKRGVKVRNTVGKGVVGEASNRIAIVTVAD